LGIMSDTLTVSLPPAISKELDALVKRTGKTRSEVVREAVRRQLSLERFRALRERLVPKAQARGLYTDEDVFKVVS
jgi:metal-responsive CopG/Arc/MetJ family transcriptional regulator